MINVDACIIVLYKMQNVITLYFKFECTIIVIKIVFIVCYKAGSEDIRRLKLIRDPFIVHYFRSNCKCLISVTNVGKFHTIQWKPLIMLPFGLYKIA